MTISIEQAQLKLATLVAQSAKGETIELTQDGQTVARIVATQPAPRRERTPGFAKDLIRVISDDDEHLKDFADYM